MIRGILGGVLWGGLFAVIALAVVSQIAEPPTGQALIPVAADKPVAVAVAELEAAAPVAEAPPSQPVGAVEAPPVASEGTAPPVDDTEEAAAPVQGSDNPAVSASEDGGSEAVAEETGAAMPLTAAEPRTAAATLPVAEESASEPDASSPAADAAPDKAAPTAAPEVPAATVAAADPTLLSVSPSATTETPAPRTGEALPQTAAAEPPIEAAPPPLPEAPPAAEDAPAAQTPSPEVNTVPPTVVTEAPRPPVAPVGPTLAVPERVAVVGPPPRAPAPARPEASRADPAPELAAAVPAPRVAELPPAPVEPPVSDAVTPDLPAEASLPDPAAAPPAPEGTAADAAPPAANQPTPALGAVTSAESAVVTPPSRLVPDAGLGSGAGAPRATGLPRIIGPAAEPEPEDAATDPVLVEAEAGLADDRPAIERFARDFDNSAGKPLFAIVLIDDGDPALDRRSLAAMPFPVTFLLDPSRPESALAASIYREGGQEVAMLATGLPQGATASDLEVTFAAYGDVLPEAVAIVDPEEGGFQGDRAVATMVAPIAAGQGRGLLSWDRGLNAAEQVARREGLRSGVIYRRLDGEGEAAGTMRRYLDRAAFKAAQDGRVIVAGATRAETVAALLEWAVEGRATTVALAPLSAALLAD